MYHPDEPAIRSLIERWVIWRDTGEWDRFATVWHPGAMMTATWFDGPATAFIERSQAASAAGSRVSHALGGSSIDVAGERAIAQTKMTITLRVDLHGAEVDIECSGRFHDLLERRLGVWGFWRRRCIYERDRVIPVRPGGALDFDLDRLNSFPEGYRHLAYAQSLAGMTVASDLPGRSGPALDALLRSGAMWIDHQCP